MSLLFNPNKITNAIDARNHNEMSQATNVFDCVLTAAALTDVEERPHQRDLDRGHAQLVGCGRRVKELCGARSPFAAAWLQPQLRHAFDVPAPIKTQDVWFSNSYFLVLAFEHTDQQTKLL